MQMKSAELRRKGGRTNDAALAKAPLEGNGVPDVIDDEPMSWVRRRPGAMPHADAAGYISMARGILDGFPGSKKTLEEEVVPLYDSLSPKMDKDAKKIAARLICSAVITFVSMAEQEFGRYNYSHRDEFVTNRIKRLASYLTNYKARVERNMEMGLIHEITGVDMKYVASDFDTRG